MAEAYLLVRTANRQKKIKLTDNPVTIGRHRGNTLSLPDDRVSRYHCVIERTGDAVHINDLGSSNGTKLNGEKIDGSVALQAGDVVKVGGVHIELIVPGNGSASTKTKKTEKPEKAGRTSRRSGRRAERAAGSTGTAERDGAIRAPEAEYEALRAAGSAPDDDENEEDDGLGDERTLRQLIDQVADEPIDETALTLINARGERMQPRAEPDKKRKKKKDQDDESGEGIKAIRLLLMLCARLSASDVHIEPRRNDFLVRIRADGVMIEVAQLKPSVGERLIGVVKVLSDLDIAQKFIVQDGHFSAEITGRTVDYRVSFTPVVHGQKLVIRVLDLANTPKYLSQLGLPDWMHQQVRQMTGQNSGMLLCCGPTGSGKTTTLYAAIREVDVQQRNVITIEDPPEYQIEGVTQTPINENQGNTFSALLRSILRQDPDVILLGEIRDGETARIALQAAMTGHLVLSTVHATDSIGTIFRLLDLGAEPYLVASALNLVLSQRLVRKLCDHCKITSRAKPQQLVRMGKAGEGLSELHYPLGCPKCLDTGFSGRRGVYELLTTNRELRDIILKNPSMQDLRKAIDMTLFNSLRQSGYRLVAEGVTSLDEIERVVGTE